MNPEEDLSDYFKRSYTVGQQTTLRFVLVPERKDKLIDLTHLSSTSFIDRVFTLGQSKSVKLFERLYVKQPALVVNDTLVLEQLGANAWWNSIQSVRLELHESGVIVIDSNITGRNGTAHIADLDISMESIHAAIISGFLFSHAFLEEVDQSQRHQQFFWNACLSGLGIRRLSRNLQHSTDNIFDTFTGKEPLLAFPIARLVYRHALAQPSEEIQKIC